MHHAAVDFDPNEKSRDLTEKLRYALEHGLHIPGWLVVGVEICVSGLLIYSAVMIVLQLVRGRL